METKEYLQSLNRAYQDPSLLPVLDDKQKEITSLLLGLSSEVGELQSEWKRHIFYSETLNVKNFKLEIGDCMYYLMKLIQSSGYTVEEIYELNAEKLRKKFPDGVFTFQDALKPKN